MIQKLVLGGRGNLNELSYNDTDFVIQLGNLNLAGAYGQIGELYLQEADFISIAIPASTWTKITNLHENTCTKNIITNGVNGTITINKHGYYSGALTLSFACSGLTVLRGAIFLNNTLVERTIFKKSVLSPNDYANASIDVVFDSTLYTLPIILDFRINLTVARTLYIQCLSGNIKGIG